MQAIALARAESAGKVVPADSLERPKEQLERERAPKPANYLLPSVRHSAAVCLSGSLNLPGRLFYLARLLGYLRACRNGRRNRKRHIWRLAYLRARANTIRYPPARLDPPVSAAASAHLRPFKFNAADLHDVKRCSHLT